MVVFDFLYDWNLLFDTLRPKENPEYSGLEWVLLSLFTNCQSFTDCYRSQSQTLYADQSLNISGKFMFGSTDGYKTAIFSNYLK